MIRFALLAAALPLLPAAPAAAQPAGEAAFQETCASCHRTPSRFMRRYVDMNPAERQAQLDRFLAGHYAEDATKRAGIIAWLEANHSRR
ncbi:hypothetical protein [Falsiroseomonas sp.]|uniref:hypothetical protein n=1 Tax=Falsiroseomonas sp. TaxID=2870721 RepID=UPI0035660BB9